MAEEGLLKAFKKSFKDFKSVKLQLRPTGEPDIAGTTARVQCVRTTEAVDNQGAQSKQDTVEVKLSKRNGSWVIDTIR